MLRHAFRLGLCTGVGIAALTAAACSGGTSPDPEEGRPTGEPTVEELVEFSDLRLPDNAEDIEISRTWSDDDLVSYQATFRTTRAAAEAFCDQGDNFAGFRSLDPPTAEEVEEFGIAEDSSEGSMTCRGAHPRNTTVDREAVVVYPDAEDAAVVYFHAAQIAHR